MRDAVRQTDRDGVDVATHLADAALLCLRASLAIGDHREAALDLLAADALLTHAAEAATESGTLETFAQHYDAVGLTRLCASDAT
jgi:hypothetical protein